LLNDVVEGLDVLDVDRRDDVNPGLQKLLNVLPTLLITGPGGVGVGKFVDEGDVRVQCRGMTSIPSVIAAVAARP